MATPQPLPPANLKRQMPQVPPPATATRSESTAVSKTAEAGSVRDALTMKDQFFMAALTSLAPWAPHNQDADLVRRAWNIADEAVRQRRG